MARCSTCYRRLKAGRCVEHGGDPIDTPTSDDIGAPPEWPTALEGCIGSGGFAAVWQIVSGGVLKVAHASHDLARARMAREGEAMAAIGTPAVPQLLGQGVLADGRAWISMERVEGTNLGDLLASGPMRIDRVITLTVKLLDCLEQVHRAGFAHRDLKPDNIFRRPDGSLVILDLGLARKLPDDPDDPNRAGVQVGSIEYMAPEQILDATTAGAAADIYAIGCILYELCTGRPPFVGDAAVLERSHAALRPLPVSTMATVPQELDQLVSECLAKQPPRRPASAAEVASRLRDIIAAEAKAYRSDVTMSSMGSGKQPVVLVWAELPRVDRALLGALTSRKVTIVSQRGRKVLGGVIGSENADPAGTALAAARDLVAAGARVALHLDMVNVVPKGGTLALSGEAVEKPESWLPATPWTGVVLTRAVASVAQVATRQSDAGPQFVALSDGGPALDQMFGRDVLIADLAAEAAAALGNAGPGLALLVGDHGIGKTAIARALEPRLVELGARIVRGVVPPPGSGRAGHTALAELIGTPSEAPKNIVRVVGDALRAAARQRPTAVILDDLHLAEHELLDALEYATLGGEPLPLWVIAMATPRLDQRRPGFGARAERPKRIAVPPLDDDAAVAMIAEHLRPAEYPPLRALRQIASIARGNPMHLATLVREIHDRGAIGTRPNGERFLDTTTLDSLPPIALGPWLAARELANLAPELASLARVCAVLGGDSDRVELAGVMQIAETRGAATTTIDLDVGLGELEAAGVLISSAGRWAFRQALLEEGIYTTTDEVARSALHAAALDYFRTKPDAAERIARHAEAVGAKREAAAAFAQLGARAHEEHRALDADQAWQGAVRNLEARDLERGRALLGRARSRYRLQRVREALVDLDEAIAIAIELGDQVLELEALIEKSTALDWVDDFEGSAAVAAQARARLATVSDPGLAIDVGLAESRSRYRLSSVAHGGGGDPDGIAAAAPLLRDVLERALAAGRDETATIAALLLGPALLEIDRLAEAERTFSELFAICERCHDSFHLAGAYANRNLLWSKRGEVERAAEDLRVVIQLAREGGHASLERVGTHNLAEDRLWQGELDEPLQLARRSLAIQVGHGEQDLTLDQLLVARVLAAQQNLVELGSVLREINREHLSAFDRTVVSVLECVGTASQDAWRSVLEPTAQLPTELRLELASLAPIEVLEALGLRREFAQLATAHPSWARRNVF